jgi:hypothetical protein
MIPANSRKYIPQPLPLCRVYQQVRDDVTGTIGDYDKSFSLHELTLPHIGPAFK